MTGTAHEWLARASEDLATVEKLIDEIPVDETDLIELSTIYLDSRYPVATGYLPAGKPDLHDIKQFHQTAAAIFRLMANREGG